MATQYRGKTFKSGNSLALRLPKALGLAEGEEVRFVPQADGSFSLWRTADDLEQFMALSGSLSPGFMAEGRGDIEQEERDWSRTPLSDAA